LLKVLCIFFTVTLIVVLAPAIAGIPHASCLTTQVWAWYFVYMASVWLGLAPLYIVWQAARTIRTLRLLPGLLLLALAVPAGAGTTRCTTYEEKTLVRWHTVCDDGTRAVSTDNKTLERWDTTVTPPPGKTCTGQLNPKTRQWEGRCR
jgi:hypothetical protein